MPYSNMGWQVKTSNNRSNQKSKRKQHEAMYMGSTSIQSLLMFFLGRYKSLVFLFFNGMLYLNFFGQFFFWVTIYDFF